jgi:hypothetical protein
MQSVCVGRPRNRRSIFGKGKRFGFYRNRSDRLHNSPYPEIKQPGLEAQVKNSWSNTSTSPYAFMVCIWTILILATNLIFYSSLQSLFTMGQIAVVEILCAVADSGEGSGDFC